MLVIILLVLFWMYDKEVKAEYEAKRIEATIEFLGKSGDDFIVKKKQSD